MDKMTLKRFLAEERGVVTAEYVVFVAAIGILLTAAAVVMFNGMANLFSAWAGYFNAGN